MSIEIYFRFLWSSIAVKMRGVLLKKRLKSSQHHSMKKLTQAGVSNEATVIVAKDSEVFLLLIYTLGQL